MGPASKHRYITQIIYLFQRKYLINGLYGWVIILEGGGGGGGDIGIVVHSFILND